VGAEEVQRALRSRQRCESALTRITKSNTHFSPGLTLKRVRAKKKVGILVCEDPTMTAENRFRRWHRWSSLKFWVVFACHLVFVRIVLRFIAIFSPCQLSFWSHVFSTFFFSDGFFIRRSQKRRQHMKKMKKKETMGGSKLQNGHVQDMKTRIMIPSTNLSIFDR
jgi:hypothetical protein